MMQPERAREEGSRPWCAPATRTATDTRGRLDDLHDGVIQTLFGVGLTLQAAAATAEEEELAVRLQEAADNLARVVRDLREYAATHDMDHLGPLEV